MKNLCKFIWAYLSFHGLSLKHLGKNIIYSKKDNTMECYENILHYMKTNIRPISKLPSLSTENTLFLCNHRSAADFFVDGYLTNGAGYIGLVKSFFYLPFSCILGYRCKSLVLFRRKDNLNRLRLYEKSLKLLRHKSMIIYPEGSRNIKNTYLPLKKGFLKFAYQYNIPVQILITGNKEKIFSSKTLEANRNVTCPTTRSHVMRPHEYKTLEHWIQAIETEWTNQWNQIYNYNSVIYIPECNF